MDAAVTNSSIDIAELNRSVWLSTPHVSSELGRKAGYLIQTPAPPFLCTNEPEVTAATNRCSPELRVPLTSQWIQTLDILEKKFRNAQQLAQAGHWPKALGVLNTVTPKDTYRADYKMFRARLLLGMNRTADALSDIDEADAGTASPGLLALRAEVEEKLGRIDAAIQSLTRAIEQQPSASLLARRAVLLRGAGHFDEAREDLKIAIEMRPQEGELYRLISSLHHFVKDDPLLEEMRHNSSGLPAYSRDRIAFEFAEAKALDDLGEYDAAFACLSSANAAMRALFPFDISTRLNTVKSCKDTFRTFDAGAHTAAEPSDYAPIFITGMPRSGTTLVEQILSSHALVQAGGETARFLPHMIDTIGNPTIGELNLSPEMFGLLGRRYHADMLTRLHIAKRHTDKSLQTMLYAGPICAALPKAKFIVVTRHRNAIALSLLKHVFRPGKQLFSYSLSDIRAYQRSFDEMVAFWMERLPGAILTVAYEDIVSQSEKTIREMLDFVGLDWDPACLHPEKNTRDVQTLSAVSVRSPIGSGAKNHWRNYARFLTD